MRRLKFYFSDQESLRPPSRVGYYSRRHLPVFLAGISGKKDTGTPAFRLGKSFLRFVRIRFNLHLSLPNTLRLSFTIDLIVVLAYIPVTSDKGIWGSRYRVQVEATGAALRSTLAMPAMRDRGYPAAGLHTTGQFPDRCPGHAPAVSGWVVTFLCHHLKSFCQRPTPAQSKGQYINMAVSVKPYYLTQKRNRFGGETEAAVPSGCIFRWRYLCLSFNTRGTG